MKNRRILSAFLAVFLLFLLFTGCAKNPEPVEAPEPVIEGPGLDDLVETDSLVIYIMKGNETLDQRRINQFIAIYDVDVEVILVDGYNPEYTERVMNDLAAGSGPDVLFLNDLYSLDFTKAALNGNFLDLTDILAEDPEFSKDDYLDGVFEACQVNGRQYTVPVSYAIPLVMSSEEKLEELGFDWGNVETTADFAEAMGLLTPDITQDPSFTQMLYSKNYFYRLLWTSGISLVDYEAREVLPDETGLREFLEGYKVYFPYDYEEGAGTWSVSNGAGTLASGICAFWYPDGISRMTDTIQDMKERSCNYEMQSIPSQKGDIVGTIYGQIAISANAKNSLNAYNFIKFMLSEEAQKDQFTLLGYMPIHKEVIREGVYDAHVRYKENGYYFYDDEKLAFSEEEAEILEAAVTGVDRFVLRVPQNVTTMVQESMLPFFRDEASYEDCLADLKNKLMLYLSE